MEEEEEARAILKCHQPNQAQLNIEPLTSPLSDYNNTDDLINMYADTASCVYDSSYKIDGNSNKAQWVAEGVDNNAEDYCAIIVLLLVAVGVTDINASGRQGCLPPIFA